jgi:2-methylaconitate cis-trans-isomerase PrpF
MNGVPRMLLRGGTSKGAYFPASAGSATGDLLPTGVVRGGSGARPATRS